MLEPLEQFKLTLRQHGQSITRTRLLVFEALQDQEPLTMQQLIDRCSVPIDRASIYRTVTLLERLGIIQRLQIGWKYRLELSDAYHHHHHHLTCNHCGTTISLPENEELEKLMDTLAQAQHFTMQRHQLEIQGLCKNCRQS